MTVRIYEWRNGERREVSAAEQKARAKLIAQDQQLRARRYTVRVPEFEFALWDPRITDEQRERLWTTHRGEVEQHFEATVLGYVASGTTVTATARVLGVHRSRIYRLPHFVQKAEQAREFAATLDAHEDPRFCHRCSGKLKTRGGQAPKSGGYTRYKVCDDCGATVTTTEHAD